MRKGLAVVGLTALLVLTGCSAGGAYEEVQKTDEQRQSSDQERGDLYEQKVKLSDGRTITCIVYNAYKEGGLSCDWEKESSLG